MPQQTIVSIFITKGNLKNANHFFFVVLHYVTESGMTAYTLDMVADRLNLSLKIVRRYVAAGALVAYKERSRYVVYESDLKDFEQTGKPQSIKSDKPHSSKSGRKGVDNTQLLLFDLAPYVSEKKDRPGKNSASTDDVNWADISPYWNNTTHSELTFIDLFCGAGGLSRGLEMAGLNGICGLDFFKEAGLTYRRNFKHPFVYGDITKPEIKAELYKTVSEQLAGRKLNVISGGFPCQGFSMAGNRIADDPRNALYKEMLEIVRTLQPDFVLCENVKGLRSMLGGAVEKKIIADYKAIGYEMNVTTLCAADYYTPQKRERVIFIGNRHGLKNYHPKPILSPDEYITTGQAIGDLQNHPEDPGFNHIPTRHNAEMQRRIMECPEGESLYKGYSDAWKKCPWNEASCTVKENHGGVNLHPKLPRVLTAREMARLQSFPDDFIFEGPKNKQLVQIGNAVPCLLAKAIGLAIRVAANELQ